MSLSELLCEQLAAHADPIKAQKMQAYMKTQQPFFGVAAPLRKTLFRQAINQYPITTDEQYQQVILSLWQGSHREMQYQALEVAERFKTFRTASNMPLYEQLLLTAENWDTVDWIATTLVGLLLKGNLSLQHYLLAWREHPNFWLRRSSLIAHIKHKQDTQTALLSDTILMLAPEKGFFIRKAIGWTLREYSKTNAEWVVAFVNTNREQLSGLSHREALKWINKNQEKQGTCNI